MAGWDSQLGLSWAEAQVNILNGGANKRVPLLVRWLRGPAVQGCGTPKAQGAIRAISIYLLPESYKLNSDWRKHCAPMPKRVVRQSPPDDVAWEAFHSLPLVRQNRPRVFSIELFLRVVT